MEKKWLRLTLKLAAIVRDSQTFVHLCNFFQVEDKIKMILERFLLKEEVNVVEDEYVQRHPRDQYVFNQWEDEEFMKEIISLFEKHRMEPNFEYDPIVCFKAVIGVGELSDEKEHDSSAKKRKNEADNYCKIL